MNQPLPPAVPRAGGPVRRALGRAGLRALRWRIEGEVPDLPKMVAIVVPHTSNWDFVIGVLAKLALGLDASWLGKHTIFRGPAGRVFRWLGGIPVDRRAPHGVVEKCVAEFGRRPAMVLGLAPEGTRTPVPEWRTGFWHIAKAAGVPILPVALDWERRAIRIGAPVRAEGELEEQLPRIKALFADLPGRRRTGGPRHAA